MLRKLCSRHNGKKNLVISIVILVEILMLCLVTTYAWVETVSSVKLATDSNHLGAVINNYLYTDAKIGEASHTIDLADYFKQSGNMHLAPASSANGRDFYFPMVNNASNNYSEYDTYRKGDASDKNTAYLSASFRIKVDEDSDFFFTQVPSFKDASQNDITDIRVSVTTKSLGSSETPVTTIHAASSSTTPVVNSVNGGKGATKVTAFSGHIKGTNKTKLFSVGVDETKIVTINVWLQKDPSADTDLSINRSQAVTISNLGITSDMSPRHITLIPTPEWDKSDKTEYYYAWCWDSSKAGVQDRLYKLDLDEDGHYAFDYNGTYRKTLFIRCGNANLTTESMSGNWSNLGLWNKTADTTIPNSPINPTYVIQTISGGAHDDDLNANKSTGDWVTPDTAIVRVALCTGQDTPNDWGTVTATSYIGTTTSTHVMESTSSQYTGHEENMVHAWPSKKLRLTATAASNDYAFVGWYTNAAGTGNALSSSTSYEPTAPADGSEITYYAKFKERRTLTINRVVDGNANSTAAAGTITIDGSTTANTAKTKSKTVDKGTTVTFSAAASTGYTLDGIYTTASGGTLKYGPDDGNGNSVPANYPSSASIVLNDNTTYYARFTVNKHSVTASAIGSTGSTVQVDTQTAGTTCTKSNINYNSSVTIKAIPVGGYKFAGWYTDDTGTTPASNSTVNSTTYTYTDSEYKFVLGDSDVTYYAKFEVLDLYLTGYLNGADEASLDNSRKFSYNSTSGKYELTYKFTGSTEQFVTICDGTNAYHPGSVNAGTGTVGSTYNSYIVGNDTNNPAPYYKWYLAACTGTKVTFTWDHSTKILSWTFVSRDYYLKPNSNWTSNSARFALFAFKNSDNDDNEWYNMTQVGSTGYYVAADVPVGFDRLIFCRMKGDDTTNSFNNPPKWNQTHDLTVLANKNCFTIASGVWDTANNDGSTWSLYPN